MPGAGFGGYPGIGGVPGYGANMGYPGAANMGYPGIGANMGMGNAGYGNALLKAPSIGSSLGGAMPQVANIS
jgi:hypothetical protein